MCSGIENKGAIFVEGSEQAGTARSAWEPEYKWVFGDVILWFEEDVMDAFIFEEVDIEIAWW